MGREEEVELRSLKYTLLFLISLSLFFCGSDEVDESFKVKNGNKQVPLSEINTPESTEKTLEITGVKFSSTLNIENDIVAIPELSDKQAVKNFRYRWFINDREIQGETGLTLSRDYLNENDWVFCLVSIREEGESYPEFKSKLVKVKGALPVVNLTMVEKFDSPGIFRYKINAEMPRTEDEEPEFTEGDDPEPEGLVKFELISPLDKGIELNSLTGEIVWNITDQIIEELGDKVTIKFSVISPSGRKVNSSISLILKDVGTQTGETGNGSSMGSEIE